MSTLKKILICDDSPAEVRLMKSVLDKAGYWSVAINDSTRVENSIEVERPSLVLLDVVMPLRNGYQVCRDLKSDARYSRIPVIVVSSKNGESDKFWAKQQGADDYVVKPYTPDQLLQVVQRYV